MINIFERSKYPRQHHSKDNVIPDSMGYPRSDYSRYDPYGEERMHEERTRHALEGAGRRGWDYDQNRSYGAVYGNSRGRADQSINQEMRNFKGKGPRNYTRSDERILEDVHHRLAEDDFIDASAIEIKVEKGEVTLSGEVFDKSSKRRAEDLTESISGVTEVENRLRIHSKK